MTRDWENVARPWPETRWRRWTLRFALALPFIALAVWADSQGWQNPTTVGLDRFADMMVTEGWSLKGLEYGYPPMAITVALLPGEPLTYGIAAALAFGWLLQLVLWQGHRRGIAPVLLVPLLAVWLGVPLVWYEASQRFDTVVSLALMTMAMAGWLRFTNADHTDGGITAGLALALCICFSPIALVFAGMFALTLPLYLIGRGRSFRALPAMLAVLLFPILVVTGWWVYMVWLFVGEVGTAWSLMASSFENFTQRGLSGALDLMGQVLVYAPVYAAVAIPIARRSFVTFLVYLVPLFSVGLGSLIHLPFMSLSLAYLLLCLIAIVSIPTDLRPRTQVAIAAVAIVQLALMLVWPFQSGYYPDWLAALGWS